MRKIYAAIILAFLSSPVWANSPVVTIGQTPIPGTQIAACCKVCIKGKACGDSCIKKTYNCTKPKGCACDG